MALLSASDLSKYFGAEEVFSELSLEIHPGDRIALVGANGTGKSSLLKILVGELESDSGTVHKAQHVRVGYLPQAPDFESDRTLWQAMEAVFSELKAQREKLRRLEAAMAAKQGPEQEAAMHAYGALLDAFEQTGGFTYEARIGQVLGGLGFHEDEFTIPVSYLSGGEKTRALLARLLLEEPDLLLLDEPTNHLDLDGIEWLEERLKNWKGALVVVAHDRAFLDAIASRVWEMENTRLFSYRGNYTDYVMQREERRRQQLAAYEAQQAHIERTESYIRRYKAGQRAAEARGRLKRLEREERIARPQEQHVINVDFQTTLRSGDLVLGLYDLEAGYDSQTPLLTVEEAQIKRGQRVALVGPNGSGKTTLLRTILRKIKPTAGRVRIGAAVRIGYFAQVQAHLDPERSVLDTLLAAGMVSLSETRSFLARYGFRGDEVFKDVGVLSGGERARVALAILALQRANFLLLDEPTNNLDLASQEVLQDVLTNFSLKSGGTILLVSHDRYLIRVLATHVWAIADNMLYTFEGYDAYETWHQLRNAKGDSSAREDIKAQARAKHETEQQEKRARQRRLARQQQRLQDIEAQIHALESRMQELTTALDLAGRAQDISRVSKLGAEYRKIETSLNHLLEEWVEVAESYP